MLQKHAKVGKEVRVTDKLNEFCGCKGKIINVTNGLVAVKFDFKISAITIKSFPVNKLELVKGAR